jgi:hypothetical protein
MNTKKRLKRAKEKARENRLERQRVQRAKADFAKWKKGLSIIANPELTEINLGILGLKNTTD